MRLFFDVNVVLDVLAVREPWAADSAAALSLLESRGVEGLLAAHAVTTLHYLTFRHLPRERANAALLDLFALFEIVPVDQPTLLKALTVTAPDFEDAVQAVCALNAAADFFVTRSTKDFAGVEIRVISPAELLALLRSGREGEEEQ